MPLSANLLIRLEAVQSKIDNLITPQGSHLLQQLYNLSDGVGAGQADRVYSKTRTLAAGANEDLDFAGGVLTDVYGTALTFARIKVLAVRAAATNPNAMTITRPANGIPIFAASGDAMSLAPGETKLLVCRTDITGIVVTAATGDLINFLAGAGANHLYDILAIGSST